MKILTGFMLIIFSVASNAESYSAEKLVSGVEFSQRINRMESVSDSEFASALMASGFLSGVVSTLQWSFLICTPDQVSLKDAEQVFLKYAKKASRESLSDMNGTMFAMAAFKSEWKCGK